MHEFSIAQSLINILEKECKKNNINKVKRVNLKIGVLTTIVPESLKFAFGVLTKNTIFKNAKLFIKNVPLITRCKDCGTNFEFTNTFNLGFLCKKCKGSNMEVKSGKELLVESIEGR